MRWGIVWAIAFASGWMLVPACSSDSKVTEASCSACAGRSFTEADCKSAGATAGCASSTFVANVPGCTNGCKFESCNVVPECGEGTSTRDAGQTADAAVDPACANAPKGLFSVKPPCTNVGTITINGATQYVCNCGQPCPCNFVCGSIDLPQGGTVGSVCAPR